jgi:hypothetical protein
LFAPPGLRREEKVICIYAPAAATASWVKILALWQKEFHFIGQGCGFKVVHVLLRLYVLPIFLIYFGVDSSEDQ